MVVFRAVWVRDIIAAIVAVAFSVLGIADGTVSSFNFIVWLAVLGGLAGTALGAREFHRNGHAGAAVALAAVLAVPAFFYGLLLLVAVVSGVRWN